MRKKRAVSHKTSTASAAKVEAQSRSASPRLPTAIRRSGSVVRYCSPFMAGLYPLLCTSVMETLRCVRIAGTYDQPQSRWVVASQPYLVCLGPEHKPAAVLAVASLALFVVGFPLTTLVYLSWHRDKWLPRVAAKSEDSEKPAAGTYNDALVHMLPTCVQLHLA